MENYQRVYLAYDTLPAEAHNYIHVIMWMSIKTDMTKKHYRFYIECTAEARPIVELELKTGNIPFVNLKS